MLRITIGSLFLISSFAISACELVGESEIQVREGDLLLRTDSSSYIGRRSSSKSSGFALELTYVNNSQRKIYLSGCGNAHFKLLQLVDGEWVVRHGLLQVCNLLPHPSVFVAPGESKVFEIRKFGHDDHKQAWSWGESDISGTYRIEVGAFLDFDFDSQRWDRLVPESGLRTESFEIEERCVVAWRC